LATLFVAGGAAATENTDAMPVPFEAADSNDLCMRSINQRSDRIDFDTVVYQVYSYYNGKDDARTVIARVKKKLGELSGMRAGTESYGVRSGALQIQVDAPDPYIVSVDGYARLDPESELRPFPINVTVDSAINRISVVMMPNRKQPLDVAKAKLAACKLAAAAMQTPDPVPPPVAAPPKRKIFNNPFKREEKPNEGGADQRTRELAVLIERALYERSAYAGKAFVLVPMLNLVGKYEKVPLEELQTEGMTTYWQDASSRGVWQMRGNPSESFASGPHTSLVELGNNGFWAMFLHDKTIYVMYIVEPGTYDLTALAVDLRNTDLGETNSKKWKANPPLGVVGVLPTVDAGYFMNTEWQSATYRTRTREEAVCTLAVGGVGPCLSYSSQMVTRRELAQDAHYEDVKHAKPMAGIALTASLAKPAASFTVGRGDVALIEGVYPGSLRFDRDACKGAGNGSVTCALTSAQLWQVPADLAGLKETLATMPAGPGTAALGNAKVVPVTINPGVRKVADIPGSWEAGWAKQLTIGN
jgi:hypothetical protein